MDDSLIYIIVLIIVYIVQFFMKKKEEPGTPAPPDQKTSERPAKRPASLEELLQEMVTAAKGEEVVVKEEEAMPEPEPQSMEEYRPQYETLEDPYFQYQADRDAEARSIYEDSIRNADKFKTLDEQVNIEDIKIKFDEPANQEKSLAASKYAKMFQNPESLKDAIIMSEILNRKYD